jgi:Domain of unknown function (DUF4158)
VPVEFLSDDQAAAYERFVGDLSRSELEGFFLLDSTALDLIANKRGDHNRLGAAVQIGTVRYLGRFLTEDPLDVPWSVVEYVAGQLDIADPSVVKRYTERPKTAYEHSWEIRAAYGYRDFAGPGVHEQSVEFMSARAWIHDEGAVALFDQARAWLRRERVLLPGVSVLARLVATGGRTPISVCTRRSRRPPWAPMWSFGRGCGICSRSRRSDGSPSWNGCARRRGGILVRR